MRYSRTISLTIFLAFAVVGCESDQVAKENLTAGFNSFQNPLHDSDYSDALARADAQIQKDPHGKGSAEAYYLRGRAIEQRVKHSDQQAHADLAEARQAYLDALQRSPATQLEEYIRISLGNVCYWQDDYASALQQWSAVQGKSGDDAINAFAGYRIGLCEQRLGNFAGADQTFTQVAQRYPNTEAAMRSQQHIGFKYFSVQLATYPTAKAAEANVQQLVREGALPKHIVDGNKHIVTIGPANTYTQAEQLKARFVTRYPEAMIVP